MGTTAGALFSRRRNGAITRPARTDSTCNRNAEVDQRMGTSGEAEDSRFAFCSPTEFIRHSPSPCQKTHPFFIWWSIYFFGGNDFIVFFTMSLIILSNFCKSFITLFGSRIFLDPNPCQTATFVCAS